MPPSAPSQVSNGVDSAKENHRNREELEKLVAGTAQQVEEANQRNRMPTNGSFEGRVNPKSSGCIPKNAEKRRVHAGHQYTFPEGRKVYELSGQKVYLQVFTKANRAEL